MRLLVNLIMLSLASSAVLAAPVVRNAHNAHIRHTGRAHGSFHSVPPRTHHHNPSSRYPQRFEKAVSHDHMVRSRLPRAMLESRNARFASRVSAYPRPHRKQSQHRNKRWQREILGLEERSLSFDDLDDVERRAFWDTVHSVYKGVQSGVKKADILLNGPEAQIKARNYANDADDLEERSAFSDDFEDLVNRAGLWDDVKQVGHDIAQKVQTAFSGHPASAPPAPAPPAPAPVQARDYAYVEDRSPSWDDFEDVERRGKTWNDIKQVGADVGEKIQNLGHTVEQKFKNGVKDLDTAVNGG